MNLKIKEFEDINLLISAAETEDEVGTVLRIHLIAEKFLAWYLRYRSIGEVANYVKEPREFGNKLSLTAAFGLPLAFVRALHQLNIIRNKMVHGHAALPLDQVQEFARQVEKLVEIDQSFEPLSKRYIEIPAKRPGERMTFGSSGTRFDFLIAALALYGTAIMWAESQPSAAES